MKKGEVVLSAVCVAFFSFMFYEALELRGVRRFGEVGSGFWPLLSLSIAGILSLVWCIGNLIRYSREKRGAVKKCPTSESVAAKRAGQKKIALCSACLLVYIIVIPLIGFLFSTLLFILAFTLALEEKRKLVLVISPPVITAVIFLIFAKFITMPLPKGVGVFAEFSRLFY